MANEKKVTVNMTQSALTDFVFVSYYSKFSGWLTLVLGALGLVLIFMTWGKATNQALVCYIAVMAICLVLNPGTLWLKSVNQLKQNPSYKMPINYTFDVSKLTVEQGDKKQDVEWNEIYRLRYTKRMFAIYTNPYHAFVIPNSELGEDEKSIVSRVVQYTAPHKPRISASLKEFKSKED